MSDPLPTRPFEKVSADLYEVDRLHVLVNCCRFSGWPIIHQWFQDQSAREVMDVVTLAFSDTGVPTRLRSDGGPQFKAHIFQEMLKKWNVVWGPSSAYYPQSNSHAEAAVKAAKDLVIKEAAARALKTDTFRQALLGLRNTPRACGKSPVELLFDHQLRSVVPAHWSSFAPQWQGVIKAHDRMADLNAALKEKCDESACQLSDLHVGTGDMQIIRIGTKCGRLRLYQVRYDSGSLLWRNRRHLKPMRAESSGEEKRNGVATPGRINDKPMDPPPQPCPVTRPDEPAAERPRRSETSKRTPARYNDFVVTRS